MSTTRKQASPAWVDAPVTLEQVHELFQGAVPDEPALTLLKGFKLDFSGNRDFHKVFFSARCHCGTVALLTVEVAKSKTLPQTEQALPSLVQHLRNKAQTFRSMSCEMHTRMRAGDGPSVPATEEA